jgi:hypothetical protein
MSGADATGGVNGGDGTAGELLAEERLAVFGTRLTSFQSASKAGLSSSARCTKESRIPTTFRPSLSLCFKPRVAPRRLP